MKSAAPPLILSLSKGRDALRRLQTEPVEVPSVHHKTVVVLDFGGQTAMLIARRVRECGVYSELLPFDATWEQVQALNPAAFILSGAVGGLAGILLANEGAYVSPAMMSWVKSGDLIVIVVLGGMGTLFGPLYGTIAFFVLEESLKPLLDLGRNDVGRVALGGTVEVTDSYAVEHYSRVMHIVSNVVGRLDPAKDALDALFAGFPAGTVSGAPKVRACEIIAELEPSQRGVYCGAIGYWSVTGSLDSSIAIRTAVARGSRVYFSAGGGIVADSVPEQEYRETLDKARGMIDGLLCP